MDQPIVALICVVLGFWIVVAYELFSYLRQGQLYFRAARARLGAGLVCEKCGSEILVATAKYCGRCGGKVAKAA